MNIPQLPGKKALILIDLQESFSRPANQDSLKEILRLLESVSYDAYVAATFHTELDSIWQRQEAWECPAGEKTRLLPDIAAALQDKKNVLYVEKQTRSAFKGNADVKKFLLDNGIETVHVVGWYTYSCVIATAQESFDHGFLTHVIEECSGSSSLELHESALSALRKQHMTNNSRLETVPASMI